MNLKTKRNVNIRVTFEHDSRVVECLHDSLHI